MAAQGHRRECPPAQPTSTLANFTFGFEDDGRLRDRGDMSALGQGRAIGGRALRLVISRERVQKGRGAYDFSTFDNIVNRARQLGIHPQIVLDNLEGFSHHGMGDPGKYEQFVKAAATHFKGRVGTYSLINEPDMKMSPHKYRELFVRGQKALSGVDNGARVLFGEFSPNGGLDYARKVIGKRGLTASGFAIHPYQGNDPLAPPAAGSPTWGIGRAGTMQKQLAHMNLKTRAGKTPGLYFTEFGYTTDTPNAAAYWPRALQKARRAGVREMIAYTMTGPTPNGQKQWDTGLLNPDGTPRPTYNAIKASSRYTR
jgi:hypothetical protein